MRRLQKRLLVIFGRAQRPAAWLLMVGGLVTFVGVMCDLIALGNAKLGTLLIAADLVVGGFSATQEVENEVDEGGQAE